MTGLFEFDEALKEVQTNMAAYEKMREQLERDHNGEVALFNHGEFVDTFGDYESAYEFGYKKYGLGDFSIKKIGEKPLCMGAMTPFVKHMEQA